MTTSLREVFHRLAGLGDAPGRTALAVGLGLWVGLLPVSPFQTLLVLGAAFLLRLNRVAALAGSLVWQPFTAPFILAAEYAVGRWMVPEGAAGPAGWWVSLGRPLVVGSLVVSAAGGALGALVSYAVLSGRARQNGGSSVIP
ncbi:MAG: DUF2062 domain-containing protein [Acidobacteriota bacterium]